ncbi:hypothetical protein JTB14_006737 [Gonioctena quinquepunctata]|nr:hypothetical protein JTB14_006737 [Gonioctena quinquepunctata]
MTRFGEKKGIPQMAAGRLQRWAIFLSGLNYTFSHIKGKENGGADGSSRFPVKSLEPPEVLHDYLDFLIEDRIPIKSDDIIKELRTDIILSEVYKYLQDGLPEIVFDKLKFYFRRMSELSIDNRLLMMGLKNLDSG